MDIERSDAQPSLPWPHDRRPDTGPVIAILSAGPFLVLLAFTVPLTTLTSTAVALGADAGSQAWILGAMSVGAAAGLLGSGAIGDDYGRRMTFLTGSLLLAASSVLGALSPNPLVLVLARILQGLGGAAIIACSLGLIAHVFADGPARTGATALWAAALGAGVAIGPILSAGLDELGGWRAPYALTALGALALAAAGRSRLPESRAHNPRRIDVVGTLLLGLGLTASLSGLVESRTGWDHLVVIVLLLTGVALMVGFVVVERRIENPMIDLSLFRRPEFASATVAALAVGLGVLSLVPFVPTLLERAMGFDTLSGAFILLAWSGTAMVTAFGARWLPAWVTPHRQLVGGLIGAAAGQFALLGLEPDGSLARLVPALVVAGAAYGVLNTALGRQAVASVPPDRAAMGSGANNTARFLGSAIGLAVVAVLVSHAGPGLGAAGLLSGWNMAALVTGGCSLLGAVAVLLTRDHRPRHDPWCLRLEPCPGPRSEPPRAPV